MRKPTVFISSTIFDFGDLRSALKHFMESKGGSVLASEFNDFDKKLDTHSYDACLAAIRQADFFLLLIGSRVGGWYDEITKISITRREYREAYELQCQGKLKILTFVRSQVWQVREDRKELERALKGLVLEAEVKRTIANFPSKFADDAASISDFITETTRAVETKKAVQAQGVAPIGNWVHQFSTFGEIATALDTIVFSGVAVNDMADRRLLLRELREILVVCLPKWDKEVFSPWPNLEAFRRAFPIDRATAGEAVEIPQNRWNLLSALGMHMLGLRVTPVVLPQMLGKQTFLEFDLETGSFESTPIYEALSHLSLEIQRLTLQNRPETLQIIFQYSPKQVGKRQTLEIPTLPLGQLLALLDRWCNVIELSKAIAQHLCGGAYVAPPLRPISPFEGMDEALEEDRPTADDLDQFLGRGSV